MGEKHKTPYTIPVQILNQINESSAGGFVLFTINENGNPQVHYKFDNATNALALQHYIGLWLAACEDVNSQNTMNALNPQPEEEPDETDDGDDSKAAA